MTEVIWQSPHGGFSRRDIEPKFCKGQGMVHSTAITRHEENSFFLLGSLLWIGKLAFILTPKASFV
jgi:hypothetical protein